MSQRPFEIMRWESSALPTVEALTRMMQREGLQPSQAQLEPQSQTSEMKFDKTMVRVLVSGIVQVSFPGYGVIQLDPGDIVEINPDVLHDLVVSSAQPAVILEAFRN
jgi:hypothetical protein